MPFKPVGIDENGNFPPRVISALTEIFVTKPVDIGHGQTPVWDANSEMWISGSSSGGAPITTIDGGSPG